MDNILSHHFTLFLMYRTKVIIIFITDYHSLLDIKRTKIKNNYEKHRY